MNYTSCAPSRRPMKRSMRKPIMRHNGPAVNIIKEEDGYYIHLAIPGLTKDDILIENDQNTLTIKSNFENKEDKSNYQLKEFSVQPFERSFTISKELNQEDISAKMKHGVLKIGIPFVPKTPAKKINIK